MGTSIQSFGNVGSHHVQKLSATSIKGVASNPAYLNRESIVSTEPAAYLSDNHPIPEQYVKAVHARNAKPAQGRQFVQGVKDINQMGRDLVLRQKAGKAALQAKQNDRRARHQNIGRPAGQVKSSSNSPLNSPSNKGYVKNTRNNNMNRPQATAIGGGGPSKGPSKSPANNTQDFLAGIRGKPKTFQQLQDQLRAACSPKDIKQALSDRQSSKLSPQDHGRYLSALRRSMTNMASNPDTAHKLDSSFIKQVLRGDKAAINHTVASWGKADLAHIEERSLLLKNGQSYTAPSIKLQPDCSYGELHRQLTRIESVNDLKAVVANRAATNITPKEQGRLQGALSAVLRGMAKNPDFAGDLHAGYLDYALQGDRRIKNEIINLRNKTLTSVLERRLDRLKRR